MKFLIVVILLLQIFNTFMSVRQWTIEIPYKLLKEMLDEVKKR